MKRLPIRLTQTLALSGLLGCVAPANESENTAPLFSISGNQLWPGGKVPVCFDASYPTAKTDLIKQLVAGSWGRAAEGASSLRFTGWGVCPTNRNGMVVVVLDTSEDMKTRDIEGYSASAPTVITAGDNYGFYWNDLWYRTGVVHEFGHALGFTHELDRYDTGDKNTAACGNGSFVSGNTYGTPYDPDSIMNATYPREPDCQPLLRDTLSFWDVVGLRNAYPRNFAHLQDQGDEKADLDADSRYRFMPKDNQHDVCGRSATGIVCATSNGDSFDAPTTWFTGFTDSGNWNQDPGYYETIRYPDLNRDSRADVCARSASGIYCALNQGSYFSPLPVYPMFSDSLGWNYPQYWSTLRFPDVSGDGLPDVCARAAGGIFCANGTGSSFNYARYWSTAFTDSNAWNQVQYYSTIRFLDLNNDKKADICGRGVDGIWCALSNGYTFGTPTLWLANFNDGRGYNAGPQYYSTIRYPDLNADGRPDICARHSAGISCALNTGTAFGAVTQWVYGFDDAAGWNFGPEYYSTIQYADVSGDGKADVCGRNAGGIVCAVSTGSSFGALTRWSYSFDDANYWNSTASYWSTIRLRDVNGDGKADICGRAADGFACALSNGSSFDTLTYWTNAGFSNYQGWGNGPEYYSTIRMP
jgi:hypothetical protein